MPGASLELAEVSTQQLAASQPYLLHRSGQLLSASEIRYDIRIFSDTVVVNFYSVGECVAVCAVAWERSEESKSLWVWLNDYLAPNEKMTPLPDQPRWAVFGLPPSQVVLKPAAMASIVWFSLLLAPTLPAWGRLNNPQSIQS